MPDQLRYDSLGCTSPSGHPVQTPHIDAFARRGTLFTNCFTQASVCSQSRCSMFTGAYPHVAGHRSLHNLIKPWEPNLFRSLKENGYHVACLAPRGDTFAPTVTELSLDERPPAPEQDESIWGRLFYRGLRNAHQAMDYDDAVVRSALTWLECPPADKPWVLFMPLLFPHCPFQVEEPYFSQYPRDQMPPIAKHEDKTGYEPGYMRNIRERYGTDRATPEIWNEIKATYYGMISRLDDQFGRIIARLDETNMWKDTVSMFFTDHGEYLGDHGLIEKWPSGLSDVLVHEPLIIAGASLPAGQTSAVMSEMVDLIPTVFELCGIGQDFPHNGQSLVPVLVDGATEHKKYAYSEGGFLKSEEPLLEQSPYPYDLKAALQHQDGAVWVGKALAIRDPTWTYIYRLYEPAELYHRHDDLHELHNLAETPEVREVVKEFEREALRWMVDSSDFVPWAQNDRFPKVDLVPPREQLETRRRAAGGGGDSK
ncbi:choline-sulfatase [Apiospora hydei]|uniref:Choline-sulfatase n=1 Tax=Apiospora hydei TaxID=1337664 RepID=A0ABR1X9U2_9PEZI